MHSIILDLSVSPELCQSYYQGLVKQVVARTIDGRSVRFPANILQKVITRDGIHGRFEIRFSDEGKFLAIEQLG